MKNILAAFLIAACSAGLCLGQTTRNHATTAQSAASASAPAFGMAAGSIIPAELAKSVDAKKVKTGDEVVAKISQDLLSHGQVVIPRGTKIVGHVTTAKARDKAETQSELGIAFDRITLKDGREVPLKLTIQAVGPPMTYATSGVPQPSSGGLIPGSGGYGPAGGMPSPNSTSEIAANPSGPSTYPGDLNGPSTAGAHGQLSSTAQGLLGMPDFSLNQGAEGAVVSSQKKNVKLDSGTQLLLRVGA